MLVFGAFLGSSRLAPFEQAGGCSSVARCVSSWRTKTCVARPSASMVTVVNSKADVLKARLNQSPWRFIRVFGLETCIVLSIQHFLFSQCKQIQIFIIYSNIMCWWILFDTRQNLMVEILHHGLVTGSASSVCEPQCSERAAGGCLLWRNKMRFLQRST